MTISRRSLLAGTAAAATTITLRDLKAQNRTMTFVTPFAFILAFVDIMHTAGGGYFEREGLNVTIEQGRNSSMALQQVLGGNALASRTGGSDHIKASARPGGEALISIGTIAQGSPFWVISRADRPIRNPQDMRGKRVGVISVGGAVENTLDAMLVARGVPVAEVQREGAGNAPAGFQLIAQGRIDCYIVSSGTMVTLRAANEPILAWNTDEHAPIPGQCYIAQRSTVARDGDMIVRFLRAMYRSINDMLEDRDFTRTMARIERYEVGEMRNRALAPAIIREETSYWLTAGRDNILRNVPERWQRGYDLMAAAGLATPGGQAAPLYTNEFVDAAKRG